MSKKTYDCDTSGYWCSEEDYNSPDKKYGRFTEEGKAYEILNKNTPRPWLNYLVNDKVGSVVSNTGLGFMWYKSPVLRVTHYEHPYDYLPREFKEGRKVIVTVLENGKTYNIFRDAINVTCVHRPGHSVVSAEIDGIKAELTIFVPENDPCECLILRIITEFTVSVKLQQKLVLARFGIHFEEYGVPYYSTPGANLQIETRNNAVFANTTIEMQPKNLYCSYFSPDAETTSIDYEVTEHVTGRIFKYPIIALQKTGTGDFCLRSNMTISETEQEQKELYHKYSTSVFEAEFAGIKKKWDKLIEYPSCSIPDQNMQSFLNVWFKNQIFLTYRYIRSVYRGYRDTIQDTWGYQLLEPKSTRNEILKFLSYMLKDGSCPRNFSPFGKDDEQDLRNNMDSATWLAMCINDYIKETGDLDILKEKIAYLDDDTEESVENHIMRAFDLLFEKRGYKGMCLTCDGDWNDALEGISKYGPAVSVWLTVALYNAQKIFSELFLYIGDVQKAELFKRRCEVLKEAVNENAWDGEWYIYAFAGTQEPIGSKVNNEGKIHLNVNTWAILSGLAEHDRAKQAMDSINKYLSTPIGPMLLTPPYVHEGDIVGRIARLEPGTFENGAVYQHAVAFKIYADIALGDYQSAYQTFVDLLPTNPENFDARRSSEPYCTGNYYCGPSHQRFGQNFFTWFTGNAAWLLRAAYDEILGVKADYQGLKIEPKVPLSWNQFSVKRLYRGAKYDIFFKRADEKAILVDGVVITGNVIPVKEAGSNVVVQVLY